MKMKNFALTLALLMPMKIEGAEKLNETPLESTVLLSQIEQDSVEDAHHTLRFYN
jgi:hypothetical protein